jgi:LPXTG-motif cell wall-anchored protein
VRRALGVIIGAVLAVAAVSPAFAGAQEVATQSPSTCSFSIDPSSLSAVGTVTITGTAPEPSQVTVYVDGHDVGTTPTVNGSWSLAVPDVKPGANLSANYSDGDGNAYTHDCSGAGGVSVERVIVDPVAVQAAGAQLAFTGSSNTSTYVIVGAAALLAGLVLLFLARRRSIHSNS